MLSKERREELRGVTIDLVLEARKRFLATGVSLLTHWDQIQTRLVRATRYAVGFDEWVGKFFTGLRIGAPTQRLSEATDKLRLAVGADASEWLRMLEDEAPALIARCRAKREESAE